MFRSLLDRFVDGTTVLRECRNCGTTLDDGQETCPSCGCEAVVEYELEDA